MVSIVYGLCAFTALACAMLLLRAYRATQSPILWWSGLCFCGLMTSNVILVVDKLVVPTVDLLPLRLATTLLSMGLLIYGLVSRSE